MRKGLWSPDEDERLSKCIAKYMGGSWSDIAKKAGLDRCGKSCRRRWMNHLRPDLKRGRFTPAEVRRVVELHQKLGNRWSEIASHLVGRTDNDVKNLWNTQIKRHLKHFQANEATKPGTDQDPETAARAPTLDIDMLIQAITAASTPSDPTPASSAADSGPSTSSSSSDADTKSASGDVNNITAAVSPPSTAVKRVFSFPLFPHAFSSGDSPSPPTLLNNNKPSHSRLLAPSRSISEASNLNSYINDLTALHAITNNINSYHNYNMPSATSCPSLLNHLAEQHSDFGIGLIPNSAGKLNTATAALESYGFLHHQNSINNISDISLRSITSALSSFNDQDSSNSRITMTTNVAQSDNTNVALSDDQQKIQYICPVDHHHNNGVIVGSEDTDDWMALWSSCLDQQSSEPAGDLFISTSQDCWSLDSITHII